MKPLMQNQKLIHEKSSKSVKNLREKPISFTQVFIA